MLPDRIIKNNRKYTRKGNLKYNTKSYANPFFTKKKRKNLNFIKFNFSFRLKISFVVLAILFIVLLWFLFYSKFFVIKTFEISGTGRIDTESIEKMAQRQKNNTYFGIIPQKNIFFFNEKKLKQKMETGYSFEFLEITKDLPDKIKIEYQEKKYAVIWVENEKFFYADKEGNVITETNPLEITEKNYPLVYNLTSNHIRDNKISIEQKYIDSAIKLFNNFKKQEELVLEKLIIDSEIDTIKVKILEGPEIYFNMTKDLEKQYKKLIILKTERLKMDFNKKIYIDLRIGDSIYYR